VQAVKLESMAFNFRVLARQYPDTDFMHFGIYEVYYDEAGNPTTYIGRIHSLETGTIEDLDWMVRRASEALAKPILWYGDKFPQEYKP